MLACRGPRNRQALPVKRLIFAAILAAPLVYVVAALLALARNIPH